MSDPLTPGITMTEPQFRELLRELSARGGGVRESGAFLLARRSDTTPTGQGTKPIPIVRAAYYDDLDPHCLTGGITFGADGYSALNALCRTEGLTVAADIHTHPGDVVHQSGIDASHPMTATDGHLALIAPHYGQGSISVQDLGAHVLRAGGWQSFFDRDVHTVVRVTRLSLRGRMFTLVQRLSRKSRELITRRKPS